MGGGAASGNGSGAGKSKSYAVDPRERAIMAAAKGTSISKKGGDGAREAAIAMSSMSKKAQKDFQDRLNADLKAAEASLSDIQRSRPGDPEERAEWSQKVAKAQSAVSDVKASIATAQKAQKDAAAMAQKAAQEKAAAVAAREKAIAKAAQKPAPAPKPAPSKPAPAVDARETAIAKAAKAASAPVSKPSVSAPSKVAEKEYVIGPKRVRAKLSPASTPREAAIAKAGMGKAPPTELQAPQKEKDIIRAYEQVHKSMTEAPKLGLTAAVLSPIVGQKMKTELLKGGTPVFDGRTFKGVVGEGFFGEKAYTGTPGYDPIAAEIQAKATGSLGISGPAGEEREDVTPAISPEVTPEEVPEESVLGAAATTARERRRTRGKRAGQAGTILEGFGVLYK